MTNQRSENAEYILTLCEELAALAKSSGFDITAHVLEMAALQVVLEAELLPEAQTHTGCRANIN
jgi:hypothetical protein